MDRVKYFKRVKKLVAEYKEKAQRDDARLRYQNILLKECHLYMTNSQRIHSDKSSVVKELKNYMSGDMFNEKVK